VLVVASSTSHLWTASWRLFGMKAYLPCIRDSYLCGFEWLHGLSPFGYPLNKSDLCWVQLDFKLSECISTEINVTLFSCPVDLWFETKPDLRIQSTEVRTSTLKSLSVMKTTNNWKGTWLSKKDERFKDLCTRHEVFINFEESLCEVMVVSIVADVIMTAACR